MLSKESKIRVLENFYALDYVFFGKPVNEVEMCCPLVKEEYLSVKGALMSVFIEMLKVVDHKPSALTEKVNTAGLVKFAKKSATIARENSEKIVTSPKAKQNIKGMLKEAIQEDANTDVTAVVEKAIRTKAFGLAVDNLLVARTIKESENISALDEWEGKIIEDSYKILRDSLVEAAYMMIYDVTDDPETVQESEEVVDEASIGLNVVAGAILGGLSPIPGGAAIGAGAGGMAAALNNWRQKNTEKIKAFCKAKEREGKLKYGECMSVGRKALLQKIKQAKQAGKEKAKKELG